MDRFKSRMSEYKSKMGEFENASASKFVELVEHLKSLEEDLANLKTLAQSCGNYGRFEAMINHMNVKLDKFTRAVMQEQGENETRFRYLKTELDVIVSKVIDVIDPVSETGPEENNIKGNFTRVHTSIKEQSMVLDRFNDLLTDMVKSIRSTENAGLTKEVIGPKIDSIIQKLASIKAEISSAHMHPPSGR